jgi:hypothetical protein
MFRLTLSRGLMTERNQVLLEKLRPASRIGRSHWHARKRQQTILVWKNNDYDSLVLLGSVNRERTERARKKKGNANA